MCDERERLLSYLYDECDADERRRVDSHLDTCAACREEIRGLRAVRQDLLAWDVPDHGSVWRPFAPARVAPWWRDVPAWALAAAASVVFLLGAGGGILTHTLLEPAAVLQAAVPATPVQAVQASVTPADLSALEQRLLATMQTEMDQRVTLAASHERTAVDPAGVLRQVQAYVKASDQEHRQIIALIQSLNNDLAVVSRRTNDRINVLDENVRRVSAAASVQNR